MNSFARHQSPFLLPGWQSKANTDTRQQEGQGWQTLEVSPAATAHQPPLEPAQPLFICKTLLIQGCPPLLCYLSLASSLAAAASTRLLAAWLALSTPHCLC